MPNDELWARRLPTFRSGTTLWSELKAWIEGQGAPTDPALGGAPDRD